MSLRYQVILQSIDGQQDFNSSPNVADKPSIKQCEKWFKGQLTSGRRLTLDTKLWDDDYNEAVELVDRETIKEYK